MSDVVLLTLPAVTLDAIGWTGTGAITGTADLTLPALTLSVESSINGSASLTLPGLTMSAVGHNGITGTASMSLPMPTLQATGVTGITGTVNASLAALALAAEGYTGILGTADLTLPMLEITASGGTITGTANLTIPALQLVATGTTAAVGTTNAWALQTEKMALSTYDDLPAFNSLVNFNGVYLGATSSGIFAITGTADGAAAIDAVLRTGMTDFGTSHLKRVEAVWLQYETSGVLELTVITDGGERTTYALPPTGSTGLHGHRQKIGQGLESKYWGFEVANVDGADFSLDVIEPKPLILQRRHGGGNA
jgi:hypothetical protein